jgi:hypothetical protein
MRWICRIINTLRRPQWSKFTTLYFFRKKKRFVSCRDDESRWVVLSISPPIWDNPQTKKGGQSKNTYTRYNIHHHHSHHSHLSRVVVAAAAAGCSCYYSTADGILHLGRDWRQICTGKAIRSGPGVHTHTHTSPPTHTHTENPPSFLSTGLHRKKKVGSNNKIHKYEFCEFDMKISQ